MPRVFACPNGHRWEELTLALPVGVRCPACGKAGQTVSDDSTFATARIASPPVPEQATTSPPQPEPLPVPVLGPGVMLAGYELQAELGRGAMGVVFRAYDARRGCNIALKTIQADRRGLLLRFKHEFRALADVAHPNLAALYELSADGSVWFFTMELVQGVQFLDYVRPLPGHCFHLERLRPAFRQLAEGVQALHQAGVLHRDIKPSNVMVEPSGRVVLMDFGLAADLNQAGMHQSTEPHLVGTIPYMAPEQAAALPVTPAADWYSVGVMLYEALTGRLPFTGTWLDVLDAKRQRDPEPPRNCVPDLPADLDQLCMEMLRREPAARPRGEEILRRLTGSFTASPTSGTEAARSSLFIGRESGLQQLQEAFEKVKRGQTTAVFVQGRSGMGKTALVQKFLESLRDSGAAVILAGRCYEREAVPFKALDGVLDALSRYLRRLPEAEARALLPRDVQALVRIFPVLREVKAVADAPSRGSETPDPHELRRRAWAGLRELLARLGDRQTMVLAIDDLQWGDQDSAALLGELLQPPDQPVLLFIGTYRSEDTASPCVQALLQVEAQAGLERHVLKLEPLLPEEARTLALKLLEASGDEAEEQAEAVVREARGSPFFVQELARHASTMAQCHPAASLDEVLWERILRLSDATRALLLAVAVAGQSLPLPVALQAADLPKGDQAAVQLLRTGRLLRLTGGTAEEVETYHDRIRETITARLTREEKQAVHHRLAEALVVTGDADPEFLATHLQESGDTLRAGDFYAQAAARAAQTLAFDRAVKLYRLALELGSWPEEQKRQLRIAYGDALSNAGRGAEAAREYLAAASKEATKSLELWQKAATAFLTSGHLEEGIATLNEALHAVGMRMPSSPFRALLAVLWQRAFLRLRGLGFRARPLKDISNEEILRIDLCWSVVSGLSNIDSIKGAMFQARNLVLSLRAGDPFRIVRALSFEAAHIACSGGTMKRRTDELLQRAQELADTMQHPEMQANVMLGRGLVAYLYGCWKEALDLCDQTDDFFRQRCVGLTWERATAQTFAMWSLTYMGEVLELSRRRPRLKREALERGDLYAATNLSTYIMSIDRLGADDALGAKAELAEALQGWFTQGFHVQHHNGLLAQGLISLYERDGRGGWERIMEKWPGYKRSLLSRIQQVRIDIIQLRGRCAVGAAVHTPKCAFFMKEAEADIRRLERERMPHATALARLIHAGLYAVQGDELQAIQSLRQAVSQLHEVQMYIYAAAARRRLGQLIGGDEGLSLIAQADLWMKGQGIVNPVRMTAMLTPGFPDA